MGHAYDFDRFLLEHPRHEGDRRRLNPERAARNLLDLRAALEDPQNLNYIPSKSDNQLLLATWNIQHFGSTKRYDESLWYIAEILSRFDLIAIQEVKQSLRDLELVVQLLGPWWKYIVSDVTAGDRPATDLRRRRRLVSGQATGTHPVHGGIHGWLVFLYTLDRSPNLGGRRARFCASS